MFLIQEHTYSNYNNKQKSNQIKLISKYSIFQLNHTTAKLVIVFTKDGLSVCYSSWQG